MSRGATSCDNAIPLNGIQEVTGSNPVWSTNPFNNLERPSRLGPSQVLDQGPAKVPLSRRSRSRYSEVRSQRTSTEYLLAQRTTSPPSADWNDRLDAALAKAPDYEPGVMLKAVGLTVQAQAEAH